MSVALEQWQEIWDREYLADYIPSGGSTVKILVSDEGSFNNVVGEVSKTAERAQFITAVVDSATTKCHLIQEIFFAVSRNIDWGAWSDDWLRRRLEEEGYIIPEGVLLSDPETIAGATGVDANSVMRSARQIIHHHVIGDKSLWYPFSIAMATFLAGRIRRVSINDRDSEMTMAWMRGDKVSLSSLRHLRITEPIGRHNARLMLISLARWCKKLGIPGICVILNLSAVYSPNETTIHYTRPALLDLYEMLRQFIDETEEMSNLAIIAVASRKITDDDKLSYKNYGAFMMRVVNDVYDRDQENPLNTLVAVHLTDSARLPE